MNELKKLRDEMQAQAATKFPQWSETLKWADTLDAYIQLQESAEPVAVTDDRAIGRILWIGVWPPANGTKLYTAPLPRESIAWWDGDKSDPSLSFNGPTKFETIPLFVARPTGPDVPKLLVQKTEAEWLEEHNNWFGEDEDSACDFEPWTDCKDAWLAALRLVGAIKEDGK